ncbi:LOW QUALITY PROTEIN: hypothetical protein YC2023_113681 [Brassica napus]
MRQTGDGHCLFFLRIGAIAKEDVTVLFAVRKVKKEYLSEDLNYARLDYFYFMIGGQLVLLTSSVQALATGAPVLGLATGAPAQNPVPAEAALPPSDGFVISFPDGRLLRTNEVEALIQGPVDGSCITPDATRQRYVSSTFKKCEKSVKSVTRTRVGKQRSETFASSVFSVGPTLLYFIK